jgi:hypothetical protein
MSSQPHAEDLLAVGSIHQTDQSSPGQCPESSGRSHEQCTSVEVQPSSRQYDDGWQSQQPAGTAADAIDYFSVSGAEVLNRVESCTLWFLSHLCAGSIPDLQLVRDSCAVSSDGHWHCCSVRVSVFTNIQWCMVPRNIAAYIA